jgi:glycosyltransferase involved in cell wall biosynthesis
MSGPTLTVLLPVYNGEQYLHATLESVLSQSYSDFEFLILDDGSTDGTAAILESYRQRDPRVRVAHHENRGVGYTLNRGIAQARGRLIAQIGADDLALPGRFERQVEFLERHPDHVLVGGHLRIIDARGRPLGVRKYPARDAQLRARMLLYNPIGAPSVMYRRADALAAGGFTPRFRTCEDYDFVLRIAQRGKIANLPEPLTAYRLHPGATKSTQTRRQLLDTIATKRAACDEYGYRASLRVRAANFAMALLTRFPEALTYWLFTKLAIRSEAGQ